MKKSTLIIIMFVSSVTCLGQSLFFDNLNNSTWRSDAYYNDSIIRISKEIGLGKLKHSTDSLKINVTIWSFKDESLAIKYYDHNLKTDSLVAIYRYDVFADKGILKLILNDNSTLDYEVGIIASGNHALLIRKKEKAKTKK